VPEVHQVATKNEGLARSSIGLLFPVYSCKLAPPMRVAEIEKWTGMATDYDAPRKTEDDSDSIEALKERVPDKLSGVVDAEDADNPGGFDLPGADLSDLDLDVVVLPPQADEFTCVECFLVKNRSQSDHKTSLGYVCMECEL
jgi:hypothetical protein